MGFHSNTHPYNIPTKDTTVDQMTLERGRENITYPWCSDRHTRKFSHVQPKTPHVLDQFCFCRAFKCPKLYGEMCAFKT